MSSNTVDTAELPGILPLANRYEFAKQRTFVRIDERAGRPYVLVINPDSSIATDKEKRIFYSPTKNLSEKEDLVMGATKVHDHKDHEQFSGFTVKKIVIKLIPLFLFIVLALFLLQEPKLPATVGLSLLLLEIILVGISIRAWLSSTTR